MCEYRLRFGRRISPASISLETMDSEKVKKNPGISFRFFREVAQTWNAGP